MTQNERIVSFLGNGSNTLTERQARKAGIKNLRARVDELRKAGFAVYNNDGEYRIGTPTRRMVQAAYRLLGGSAFAR
jgi:hypothetical protein